MLKEILEHLFEFAANSIPSDQILEAKKAYQRETGEIYEDDKSYNTRMALFLEWYLFDNYIPEKSKTILQILIEENQEALPEDKLKTYQSITETVQGLFLVKKLKDDKVKVLNLFTDEIYIVEEKDSQLIFRKNDIFQGRIICFQEKYFFTGNFCFHPEQAHKYIKPEIKTIANLQEQYKKDLAKLEKYSLKQKKFLNKQKTKINKLEEKIKNAAATDNTKSGQKLAALKKEKEDIEKKIGDLENEIFSLKHGKIQIEGNEQINKLINKFAYMNLKWERSRQIDISDIYKN